MKYLKLFENFELSTDKAEIIKLVVKQQGGSIGMGELEADSNPMIRIDDDNDTHLIDILYEDSVEVTIYDERGTALNDYQLKYEELPRDIIDEIYDLIESAIEFDFLDYDNIDL